MPTSTTGAGPSRALRSISPFARPGRPLGEVIGRVAGPLTFVVSIRLGEPATTERLRDWLALYPTLRFKLDARPDWSEDLIAELAETGAVDSVDFKGQYRGTSVDTLPDAALYRRVVDGLPEAWLEDPALTPETEEVLEPHRDRVTWDAVIHSVADIEALAWAPRTVNVKPSRFGSVERLFAAYDYCAAKGIEPTAAASSSSASAETRSSCSQLSSTPTRRTMSPRADTTSARSPGCPRAR